MSLEKCCNNYTGLSKSTESYAFLEETTRIKVASIAGCLTVTLELTTKVTFKAA